MKIYQLVAPSEIQLPVVLSIPHAGTCFPPELVNEYKTELLPPNDTDWYVNTLYQFAIEMGIPILQANVSRWIIDLNRNPNSQPLYTDGRLITGLCPATDFLGKAIYKDERPQVSDEERYRRTKLYSEPYHQQLQIVLDEVKRKFGQVLLWDCHSICRRVPSISAMPFPDMILGSANSTSAEENIIATALQSLKSGQYEVCHNQPFKGGFITRHFGQPSTGQHALQLEMCKDLYMDDSEMQYDESRAIAIQSLLKQTLQQVAALL